MSKSKTTKVQATAPKGPPPRTGNGARVFRHAVPASELPPKPLSNNGPRLYESPVEEMRDIGQSLYPTDAWIPRLALDIGEHPRQVRRWVNGEAKMSEDVLRRCRLALRHHMERMERLHVRLGLRQP